MVTAAKPRNVIRVIVFALLLDILSFTIILPLFPRLMDFYRLQHETTRDVSFHYGFADMFNIVRTFGLSGRQIPSHPSGNGGALGSLFSFLQFLTSPWIGKLSDTYGRRKTLLLTMVGNIMSAWLWLCSKNFGLFILARIVGGLSEGNVQMSIAMISDVTTPENRAKSLALVGISFALGFTVGPPIGAYFASINLVDYLPPSLISYVGINSFSAAAGISLILLLIETLFMYLCLPETLHRHSPSSKSNTRLKSRATTNTTKWNPRMTSLLLTNFLFLFFFSGFEFTLPFLTFDYYQYTNMEQGRLLAAIGLFSSLLQGFTRRHTKMARVNVLIGLLACVGAFWTWCIGGSIVWVGIWVAVTSATVVNGLTTMFSLHGDGRDDRGEVMGVWRSGGQLGRALGPIAGCVLYWWLSPYTWCLLGGCGVVVVFVLALFTAFAPESNSKSKKE